MSVSAMQEREDGRRAGSAARLEPVLRWPHGRPELDDDLIGFYMDDAASRGGYRKALDYYRSGEARSSESDIHRLRAQAWLIGRLGRYDLMGGWLEEAGPCGEFDHILGPSPAEARRNTGRLLTVGPPDAAPSPDVCTVPDAVWRTMLILDATGPVLSRAGLGAAAFLAGAGIDRRLYGALRRRPRYDPRRGAGLGGASEKYRRWIIADTSPEPHPANAMHYYYDLTDEGRRALEHVKSADAPWPRAAAAAAADLAGMDVPDMLEAACGSRAGMPTLDRMRGELDRLVGAWWGRRWMRADAAGPPCAGDAALADLVPLGKRLGGGRDDMAPALDRISYLMVVTQAVQEIAFEAAAPPSAADAVLRALIDAIRILCRRHAAGIAAAAPMVRALPPLPRDLLLSRRGRLRRWPCLAGEEPVMISDLYYCLAGYCKSRGLARDPFTVPLSETLTEDEIAEVVESFRKSADPEADDGGVDDGCGHAGISAAGPRGATGRCAS